MKHVPVLLHDVIEQLHLSPGMTVVDCTLGDAGHAEAILEAIGPTGRLIGIDADEEAHARAKRFLARFGSQVTFVQDNFIHLREICAKEQVDRVHGILMDLGWSMPQFAERGRGLSFEGDEPLDMRYGNTPEWSSAADLVNKLEKDELERILRTYGEEKLSKEIAQAIHAYKKEKRIETTKQLVEIILMVYRKKLNTNKEVPWVGGLHPATKIFQALRIAVNHELEVLEKTLPQAIDLIIPGGRLAVISFHSLEDRIVKHIYKSRQDRVRILTKKPITPKEAEVKDNPRSRSAKLRVIEKI